MDQPETPPTVEERLGRLWGFVYVGIIVVLTVLLVGKACLFEG